MGQIQRTCSVLKLSDKTLIEVCYIVDLVMKRWPSTTSSFLVLLIMKMKKIQVIYNKTYTHISLGKEHIFMKISILCSKSVRHLKQL